MRNLRSAIYGTCTLGGERERPVFDPTTPAGWLRRYKSKQDGRGGKRTEETDKRRERELAQAPLSHELEQWKLVNFKRIFDRIPDIRARK